MRRPMSRMRCAAHVCLTSVTIVILILISPDTLRREHQAQSTREARRIEMETRQRELWSLERAKRKPADRVRDARPVYQQVREDFEKLQLSSYNLSGAADSVPTLDYPLIQTEAAEIRKRAARLMSSLLLPEPEKDPKQKKDRETLTPWELKSNIASLEGLVKSFVWNPIFQQSGIVDVQNSVKARRDLEDILRLSEQIRKLAEAAGKNSGKN